MNLRLWWLRRRERLLITKHAESTNAAEAWRSLINGGDGRAETRLYYVRAIARAGKFKAAVQVFYRQNPEMGSLAEKK